MLEMVLSPEWLLIKSVNGTEDETWECVSGRKGFERMGFGKESI